MDVYSVESDLAAGRRIIQIFLSVIDRSFHFLKVIGHTKYTKQRPSESTSMAIDLAQLPPLHRVHAREDPPAGIPQRRQHRIAHEIVDDDEPELIQGRATLCS